MLCVIFYRFSYLQNFTRSRRGGRVVCKKLRARCFVGGGVVGVRGWACSFLHAGLCAGLFLGVTGDKRGFFIKSFIHVIRVYGKRSIIALNARVKFYAFAQGVPDG